MPPRTRTRAPKVLKENIEVVKKNKPKSNGKVTKPPRKALADKTNSLSDDNASIDIPTKTTKPVLKSKALKSNTDDNVRPRRERRLPPRYVENQVLKNLSNNKDSSIKLNPGPSEANLPIKSPCKNSSLVIEIQTKDTQTNAPGKKDTAIKESPLKATPIVNENASKFENPATNSNNLVPNTEGSSKNEARPFKPNKPTKNAYMIISDNGPSKEEIITAATRPRRNCRLQSAMQKPASKSSNGSSLNESSPFKTPAKDLESSMVVNRPKRICRLPSRFEDHSISPNKFTPVKPCYASTPIQQKNANTNLKNTQTDNLGDKGTSVQNKSTDKTITKTEQHLKPTITEAKVDSSTSSMDKSSPDTNNNAKNKIRRTKRAKAKTTLQTKHVSPADNNIKAFAKRLLDKSLSFRVLEDNKQTKEKGDNLDIYEFTFDPNEEPKPQKKKRKKPVKKRPAIPKIIVLKSNYNDNMSKAIANLKTKVKPSQSHRVQTIVKSTDNIVKPTATAKVQSTQAITKPVINVNIPQSNIHSVNNSPAMPAVNESTKNSIHESNYASICVEAIAADFESSDPHDNINYSPVNSPVRPATPEAPDINESNINPINKDPLNLQGDLSFFDEHPVASSSMNVSVRHPLASPWRVEFGSLPMKWHSNVYVKANMTPAVESSFINSEEMDKKNHVYTNIVPEDEPLPEIVDNVPLKQTSIISFMKEVAERSASKKKRRRSPSPAKSNAIFDDIINTSNDFGCNTPKKAKKTDKEPTPHISNNSNDKTIDKENSIQLSNKSVSPAKVHKKKDTDCTYFGFDDSENLDQENVSPVKIIPNTRTGGLRSRAVLKEFNSQARPTRAAMPVAAKPKLISSEVVEQLYDQMKAAEVAPQFTEKETAKEPADNTVATNVDDPSWHEEDDDDSQSVRLFEDIEVVCHLKAHRKSYGKPKKVAIRQRSDSDSDGQPRAAARTEHSSDDNLADLSFHMPDVKQKKAVKKKKKPKKQLSKKEEKEADEWAAGFNSMCEDINDFPLQVE